MRKVLRTHVDVMGGEYRLDCGQRRTAGNLADPINAKSFQLGQWDIGLR